MSKSKINKTKEYAIRYLSSVLKKSPQDIAKELKINLDDVNTVINTKTTKSKTDLTKDLMIRQTSVKKSNSVSIMTEGASQLSDEFNKNLNNRPPRLEKHIFRPKN